MSVLGRLRTYGLIALALLPFCTIAQAQETLSDRKQSVLNVFARVSDFSYNAKAGPYQVLAITASRGCMQPRLPSYMAQVLKLGAPAKEGFLSFEMFSLPPLARYLYMYGNCLSAQDIATMKSILASSKIAITAHGTLNHAIMQATSWYLIAQYFPDVIWTTQDGEKIDSLEVMKRLKPLLLTRSYSFYQAGYYEQSSPTYAMVNYFPLLNLIDFAEDPEVKRSAEQEAIVILALLKANSFYGRLVPPLTRNTHPQIIAEGARSVTEFPAVTQHLLWYYFGDPELSRFDLQNKREPYYLIMLALSKWTSPFSAAPKSQEFLGSINTPTFSIWGQPVPREHYGRLYMTENFAIGGGNSEVNPGGYNEDNAAFGIIYKAENSFGLIDCYHPYYRSNSGALAWENDRSSPFEEIYIGRRDGLMVFNIPDVDPFRYDQRNSGYMKRNENADRLLKIVNCRFPSTATDIEVDNGTIYFQKGPIFAAVKAASGVFVKQRVNNPEMVGFDSFSVTGSRNALYFRVSDDREFPNFDAFKLYFKSKLVSESGLGYGFTEDDGDAIEVRYASQPAEKGRMRFIPEVFKGSTHLNLEDPSVIDTPNIRLSGGRLTLRCNGIQDIEVQPGVAVPRFPVPCRL